MEMQPAWTQLGRLIVCVTMDTEETASLVQVKFWIKTYFIFHIYIFQNMSVEYNNRYAWNME